MAAATPPLQLKHPNHQRTTIIPQPTASTRVSGATVTPTPAPAKPPVAPTGKVTLRQQITGKDQLYLKSVGKVANRLRIVVDGLGSEDLVKIAFNDFFEIELDGTFGPAGVPKIEITEEWNEKEHAYFKDNITIKLADPSS